MVGSVILSLWGSRHINNAQVRWTGEPGGADGRFAVREVDNDYENSRTSNLQWQLNRWKYETQE